MPRDQEVYVTSSEAGDLLGVAQSTIHSWIHRGVLKSWKTAGGHRRIPMSEIDAMLRQRRESLGQIGENKEVVTLLLVEDDLDHVAFFRKMVERWPVQVQLLVAENGFDGLIQSGMHQPDIIVTDLVMPAMDGFQMIGKLKENPAFEKTSVIVVTALSDQQITKRGGLPRDVLVLRKPAPMDQIQALVRSLVEARTQADSTGKR
ncbi:MAG: response regulator [Magnetococcales bacterium]|nr:response regulator [Magnetococcales bacterium]MBF0322227.1 response regulator [Magnetococcales bacterium]